MLPTTQSSGNFLGTHGEKVWLSFNMPSEGQLGKNWWQKEKANSWLNVSGILLDHWFELCAHNVTLRIMYTIYLLIFVLSCYLCYTSCVNISHIYRLTDIKTYGLTHLRTHGLTDIVLQEVRFRTADREDGTPEEKEEWEEKNGRQTPTVTCRIARCD